MAFDQRRFDAASRALHYNFVRGTLVPPPPLDGPLPDISDELYASLRRTLGREPAALPESYPSPPPPQPIGTGRPYGFSMGAQLAGAGTVTRTTNTLRYPCIIRQVSFSLLLPFNNGNRFNFVWGSNPMISGTEFANIIGRLFDDQHEDGYTLQAASSDAGITINLNPNQIVPEGNIRYMVGMLNAAAGAASFYFTGILEELDPDLQLTAFTPTILAPQVLVRSLQVAPLPPAPRAMTPTVPRGLRVKVTRAGGTLYSRDIAWLSADLELKRQFLNAQLSGKPSPNLEPIW